jgi:CDP-diacylglycerol--glycerol-3-phosphate 3-phosphatidyltransferase
MTVIPAPIRRGFEAILDPMARGLIAGQISPNTITTIGTAVLLGSAVAYGFGHIRLGGALLLLSGVFDMLDGKVARGGGKITRFGAFYDSTLDRIGEAALFTGITFHFLGGGISPRWLHLSIWITLVAISSGLIVSYARARAEGLGLDCKVGIAQRAERILALGVPTLLFGSGPDGLLLLAIVFFLALTALITVAQRVVHVYRITRDLEGVPETRATAPAVAEMLGKGSRGA